MPGTRQAQFQMHPPQWTHFSRSNFGTPPGSSEGMSAWAEQISMQVCFVQDRQSAGSSKVTWSAKPGAAWTLPPSSSASWCCISNSPS